MFEIRWLVKNRKYQDPFIACKDERVLQYRCGEFLADEEEGWKDVPEVILKEVIKDAST